MTTLTVEQEMTWHFTNNTPHLSETDPLDKMSSVTSLINSRYINSSSLSKNKFLFIQNILWLIFMHEGLWKQTYSALGDMFPPSKENLEESIPFIKHTESCVILYTILPGGIVEGIIVSVSVCLLFRHYWICAGVVALSQRLLFLEFLGQRATFKIVLYLLWFYSDYKIAAQLCVNAMFYFCFFCDIKNDTGINGHFFPPINIA